MIVSRDDPRPIYHQIREYILKQITSGAWQEGDQIPTEEELCQMTGASRTPVRRALEMLVSAGYIERIPGKGTFVTRPHPPLRFPTDLRGFTEDMRSRGFRPTSRVLTSEIIPATPEIAERLRIEPGDQVFHLGRLRLVNSDPVGLEDAYLNYQLCPGIEERDFSQRSLYFTLEREYGLRLAYARRTIRIVKLEVREGRLLMSRTGEPAYNIQDILYREGDIPISYTNSLFRWDRYELSLTLLRGNT